MKPPSPKTYRSTDDVVDAIRTWIQRGRLAPGTRVPTTRELELELKVARGTVCRGLERLAELSIVIPEGRGRYRVPGTQRVGLDGVLVIISPAGHPSGWHRHACWGAAVGTGALMAAHQRGVPALLLAPESVDAQAWQAVLAQRPRGVICGMLDDQRTELFLGRCAASDVPAAAYGDAAPHRQAARVVHDHAAGAALLVDWLVDRGIQRPGMLLTAHSSHGWVDERLRGFRTACLRHARPDERTIVTDASPHWYEAGPAFDAAVHWFTAELAPLLTGAQACDAVLLASDHHIPAAAAAARRCGRKPGDDLVLLGYDGLPHTVLERSPEAYRPPVSIDKGNIEAGERLVALLLEHAEERAVMPPRLLTAAELESRTSHVAA